MLRLSIIAGLLAASAAAWAGPQEQFCAGFAEGYKTIKGNMVMVPMCPMMPMIPMGSTPFREGLKAGMAAAEGR